MENLIRIKLDPHRGALASIDFKRPCFRIYNWKNSEVEIWYSDDNGLTWDKLGTDDFRQSYNFIHKQLYVTLEFDITTVSQLAFFAIESKSVGVGWFATRYDKIGIGYSVEGIETTNIPAGIDIGSEKLVPVGAGCSIEGVRALNLSGGYTLKSAFKSNTFIGYTSADPEDRSIPVGFHIGYLETELDVIGASILGMSEYPVDLIILDDATISGLSAAAGWHKQKNVTLNGTTPEELD